MESPFQRSSGVLLHPTSLPGPLHVGDLGPAAEQFVRFLADARQTWWQTLPVGPTGYGDSPYQALSAHAGSALLVSPERLVEDGLLRSEEVPTYGGNGPADYDRARDAREGLLRRAFERWGARGPDAGFDDFVERSRGWLDEWALYRALKRAHRERPWTEWEPEVRARVPEALGRARTALAEEIRLERFVQYQFDRQWSRLRDLCRSLHVSLLGDLPIFAAHDSVEVWTSPELFHLDALGMPSVVAGVPPDYFSATGQRWGNPLYRWDRMRERGFDWWIDRLRATFSRFDALRLDHFIGFHRYWEIPATEPDAKKGEWREGPREAFFDAVQAALGSLPIVAEDLGVVTPEVKALRDRYGFPGMRVLQFAFGTDTEAPSHRPHRYVARCVVYTGTHDNDTTVGWFRDEGSASSTRTPAGIEAERTNAMRYLGTRGEEIHWEMIRLAWMSVADVAIAPAQDLLGLGTEARMNLPGRPEGNWRWRLESGAFDDRVAGRLRGLTETYERVPPRGGGRLCGPGAPVDPPLDGHRGDVRGVSLRRPRG